MDQPVNQLLVYSALIGLFTQACRTPATFARSNISCDHAREGFSFSVVLVSDVVTKKKAIVSYYGARYPSKIQARILWGFFIALLQATLPT